MQGCACVDGTCVAPEDAKISIFDWGFLHSDATYDVAHVWRGRFWALHDDPRYVEPVRESGSAAV